MAVMKTGARKTDGLESVELVQLVVTAITSVCPISAHLWLMGVETGLRGVDLRDLAWDDIDLRSNVLRIRQSKTSEPVLVSLTDTARSILEKRHAMKGDQVYVFQVDSNRSKGGPISRSKAAANIKQAVDGLKYRGLLPFDLVISMHSSRKTLPTIMYADGVDIGTIAVTLGHKDTQHTLKSLNLPQKRENEVRQAYSTVIKA